MVSRWRTEGLHRHTPRAIRGAVLDADWIPIVADAGWLIITRDSRIQDRPAEITAVKEHGAKMVALAGKDAIDTWHQLEVLFTQWRRIEPLSAKPGPFIWSATRTAFRGVPLGM